MYISIPIHTKVHGGLERDTDVTDSIRSFIELLVRTPRGSCESDPDFGFVFKSFRFENFNEDRGVLYSSSNDDASMAVYYKRKIHGRSINSNTFAHDLKKCIERYEPRLRQVSVAMEYKQKEKVVLLTIRGVVGDTIGEPFSHKVKMHVW